MMQQEPWYAPKLVALCGEGFMQTASRVECKGGQLVPIHLDFLHSVTMITTVVADVAAEEAAAEEAAPAGVQRGRGARGAATQETAPAGPPTRGRKRKRAADSGGAAEPSSRRQRTTALSVEALSLATEQHDWEAVAAFFGEVYMQRFSQLEPEGGEAGRGAWAALSPKQRLSVVQLADHLHAPPILEKLGEYAAEDLDLLLLDSLQVQMQEPYEASMQHAKDLLEEGIDSAMPVLEVLPQLSAPSKAALLEHWVEHLPAEGADAAESLQALLPQLLEAEQALLLPHYAHAVLEAPGAAGAGPLLSLLPALPEASKARLLELLGEAFDRMAAQRAQLAREAAALKSEAAVATSERKRANRLAGQLGNANGRIRTLENGSNSRVECLEQLLAAAQKESKRHLDMWYELYKEKEEREKAAAAR